MGNILRYSKKVRNRVNRRSRATDKISGIYKYYVKGGYHYG